MSPSAALQSEIFRAYAGLILGLVAVAGIVLALLRWGLKKDVRSIWRTYAGWLILVPLILGAVFLGRVAVIVGVTLLAIFGFKEFARATGLYRDWGMTGAVYLAMTAVGVVALVEDPFRNVPGWYGLFMALPVFAVGFLILIPILRNRTQGQIQALALAVLGFIYMGWMFQHTGFLTNSNHPYGYLLFILVATELNDVAAFTFGRLFGRRKLRSNISPNKTWAGSIGAVGFSLILPWLLWFSFPHFEPVHLILTGLIVGVGGQLGDLAISVIKRDIGVKDMGAVIPGHGGILDRIDSLIFVAPIWLHMINYCFGLR